MFKLILKGIFCKLFQNISYWLYRKDLPSGYGYVSGWIAEVVYYQETGKTIQEAKLNVHPESEASHEKTGKR